MAWREASVVDLRREFCLLAGLEGANVTALCAGFGISRQTGHLWLGRHRAGERLAATTAPGSARDWRPGGIEPCTPSSRRGYPLRPMRPHLLLGHLHRSSRRLLALIDESLA